VPGSFKTITFDWLCQSETDSTVVLPRTSPTKISYPFDPALGSSGADIIEVSDSSFLIRAFHKFTPKAKEMLIPLARVEIKLDTTFFQVQSFQGGICHHQEHSINREISFGEGIDLFRLTSAIETTPSVSGSSDTTMTALNVDILTLNSILGDELASQLITRLGLGQENPIVCRRIPSFISSSLHRARRGSAGSIGQLFLQAAVLDYLGLLCEFVCTKARQGSSKDGNMREIAYAIRADIEQNPQNPPTLTQISHIYGKPAKKLNAIFSSEFGQSIHSFVADCRMKLAYNMILDNNAPLSSISDALNYSHVNHFNRAFANYFHISPGTLRKKGN
jgi:AraC-like DNA-binding protein